MGIDSFKGQTSSGSLSHFLDDLPLSSTVYVFFLIFHSYIYAKNARAVRRTCHDTSWLVGIMWVATEIIRKVG